MMMMMMVGDNVYNKIDDVFDDADDSSSTIVVL